MRQQSGITKYLRQLKDDLGAAIGAQRDSPVIYGLKFCNIVSLEKLFPHHEDKTKIINIIQQGSHYHLDLIPTRTDIDRKVGGTRGGPGINTTTPHQIDTDSDTRKFVVQEGDQVTKPPPLPSGRIEITGRQSKELQVREGEEPRQTGLQEQHRMQCRKRPPCW